MDLTLLSLSIKVFKFVIKFSVSVSLSNKGQTQQWGPHFWNKSRGREGKKRQSDLFLRHTTSLEGHWLDGDLLPLSGHARRNAKLGVGRGPGGFLGQLRGGWLMTTSPSLWLGGGVTLAAHPRPGLLELVWVALNGPRWVNREEYVGVYQRQQSTTKLYRKGCAVLSPKQALFLFFGNTVDTVIKTSFFLLLFCLGSTVLSLKYALLFFLSQVAQLFFSSFSFLS